MRREDTDCVIVGAGAAGAFMAARLAEAGREVIVLEAGPAWSETDLVSSQIWARRLRWGGAPVAVGGDHPFAATFNSGWGFGGAALHHYGTWPRLQEADFTMRSRYGRGLDWPIDYQALRPYYDRVQTLVGISGDAQAEIWRPPGADYPLPPLTVLAQGRAIKRGFDALGIATAPAPMAVLSRPYNGRAACIYDGWCDAGCPTGALYNPLISDIPRARAAGADLRAGATVRRIRSDARKATGVEYVDKDGERHRVDAELVILAASAMQNPALLLNSASTEFPDGLANSSGTVGRYFMSHLLTGVFGLFDTPTDPYLGISGAQLLGQDGYAKQRADGPFGSYQWLIAPAMKPNDLPGMATTRADLFGQPLHDFMNRATRHIGHMLGFIEALPVAANRVELTGQAAADGVRGVKVVHGFDDNTLALRAVAIEEGLRVFRAAGVAEPWNGPIATAHMMGGTIMGDDPHTSVTDSFGRCHDLPNLVIAGPGLFPTAGAANPTFTVYALALRTVEALLDEQAAA
ncbi:MAG: GMC family oxidoreductase [Gammaproteobacteria bacterium]|nr:GMC family oxidoreductase [Gammaproteobacteria bacterium]